jgi:cation transport ATPase
MTSGSDRPENGLGERLRGLDPSSAPENGELMDRMFSDMKAECDRSDRTVAGFLRSRSTIARRAIVLSVFTVLALIGWFAFPVIAAQAQTMPWVASLVAFFVLLVIAMFMVTRPVHLPALPSWQVACLVFVAVGATIISAFWPIPAAQAATHDHSGGFMVGACMGVGLLLGIPVYALLRLVDRGNALGNLVAAAAAGVAGNFVLKAHCAVPGTSHELLGHASVAVVFVLGLGLVHRVIPTK